MKRVDRSQTGPDGGDALGALIAQLLADGDGERTALTATIARSRSLVHELGLISELFTGEPSMIDAAASSHLTCEECEAALPAYVEAWLAGTAPATIDPALDRHLRACPSCATQARELYQLLQGTTATAPTHLTFAEARQQQATAPSASRLWEQTTERVVRFAETVGIVLAGTQARFATLAAGLTPQLVPATVLRGNTAQEMVELLELPDPEGDLVIRLRMGPHQQDLGALALQFATWREAETLADVKVTLRDDDGSLLESTRSDRDGLALFDALEPGKYQLQIERAAQTWLIGVTIVAVMRET